MHYVVITGEPVTEPAREFWGRVNQCGEGHCDWEPDMSDPTLEKSRILLSRAQGHRSHSSLIHKQAECLGSVLWFSWTVRRGSPQ